ncbi:PspC domain-containing protein [Mangrovimicrobium sediminis]|uniref:PspC domain-containing protein n=1 Tax=Mangrovimicrobium sediminis TaxID=2562682 RepID=A0A4Z0M6W9_9GAMM|nr:PspC domain-containing protein [Haliea sp. SAOS-164]TGD75158.1 PspC domain-containing protein [Haliea sp. SAOS-164]
MSRRNRKDSHYESAYRRTRSSKARGWGMGLYRNTRDGKIAGVCAGLADHFDIAHWVMRLVWIGGFLFTGTLALWAYVGAWILLSPQPSRYGEDDIEDCADIGVAMEYDERYHDYRPKRVFRYPEPSSVRLKRAREKLDATLRRVEDMESYVTSRRFDLDREFSKL